jgi:hypothetical protein
MFIIADGDWGHFRYLGKIYHVDFYLQEGKNFFEKMGQLQKITMKALKDAQDQGYDYVLFNHGHSTSGPIMGSARSTVRSIMRSKESNPFVNKKKSIQHRSVFLAAIIPKT